MKDHLSGTSGEKQVKCRKRRECHMKEIRLHGRGGQGVVKSFADCGEGSRTGEEARPVYPVLRSRKKGFAGIWIS